MYFIDRITYAKLAIAVGNESLILKTENTSRPVGNANVGLLALQKGKDKEIVSAGLDRASTIHADMIR